MPLVFLLSPPETQRVGFANHRRKQRVVPQRRVVIQVLMAAGNSQHALPQQMLDCVLNQLRIAMVREARREPLQQAEALVNPPQKHHATVCSDVLGVERRHQFSSTNALKFYLR